MRFMLDRRLRRPPDYTERDCLLVDYRLPLLPHCHVLCHEQMSTRQTDASALLAFAVDQAGILAQEEVGDSEAFMLIQSGHTVRRRGNWHAHIFVIQYRWQKAWIYLILGLKGLAQASAHLLLQLTASIRREKTSC